MRPEEEPEHGRGEEERRRRTPGPGPRGGEEEHGRERTAQRERVGQGPGPEHVPAHGAEGQARGQGEQRVEGEVVAVEPAVAPLEVVPERVVRIDGEPRLGGVAAQRVHVPRPQLGAAMGGPRLGHEEVLRRIAEGTWRERERQPDERHQRAHRDRAIDGRHRSQPATSVP